MKSRWMPQPAQINIAATALTSSSTVCSMRSPSMRSYSQETMGTTTRTTSLVGPPSVGILDGGPMAQAVPQASGYTSFGQLDANQYVHALGP